MFLAHSIRLRRPWQCEPTATGGLRWTRSFHRPTGLEDDDLLWLVVSNLPGQTAPIVAEHALGLLLALAKRAWFQTNELKSGRWTSRDNVFLRVVGRLKPGAPLASAIISANSTDRAWRSVMAHPRKITRSQPALLQAMAARRLAVARLQRDLRGR